MSSGIGTIDKNRDYAQRYLYEKKDFDGIFIALLAFYKILLPVVCNGELWGIVNHM